jgi:hypothetical protein
LNLTSGKIYFLVYGVVSVVRIQIFIKENGRNAIAGVSAIVAGKGLLSMSLGNKLAA